MHKIFIKVEGIERRRKSPALLHLVAGFFLLLNAGNLFQLLEYRSFLLVFPAYAVGFASLAYGLLRKKFDPRRRRNAWLRGLQAGAFLFLAFFMMPHTGGFPIISLLVWGGLSLFLLLAERNLFQEPFLGFSPQGVLLPGFFSGQQVAWEEIENIVLRPDYVTVYFHENRYRQYEVLREFSPEVAQQVQALQQNRAAQSESSVRPGQ
ncbi:hypothetical protein V9K67_19510 [Paraflavisolibacter sp. H34]|uniref:hypothetical protein n=1 Tax=Huijunlia imazamoxiresistens TaxID=3127457 RepID=UPI00301B13A4